MNPTMHREAGGVSIIFNPTRARVQNHYKGLFVALTGQLVSVAQRISMVACNVIG